MMFTDGIVTTVKHLVWSKHLSTWASTVLPIDESVSTVKHLVEEESALDFFNANPDPVEKLGHDLEQLGFTSDAALLFNTLAWRKEGVHANGTLTIKLSARRPKSASELVVAEFTIYLYYNDGSALEGLAWVPVTHVIKQLELSAPVSITDSLQAAKAFLEKHGFIITYERGPNRYNAKK